MSNPVETQTDLKEFRFGELLVRAHERDGEPWFVLGDLCRALGLTNASVVASRLDEADVSLANVSSGGQRRSVFMVNESGMYEVVIRSDKPGALKFRRWITSDVLPAIRKTGSYTVSPQLTEAQIIEQGYQLALGRIETLSATNKAQALEIEAAKPKVDYHDRFVANEDVVTLKAFASYFDMTDPQMRQLLQDHRLIYPRTWERWSNTHNKKVTDYEWHAYAGKYFHWFDERPQHTAPRRHNGQVRTTLYVRQAHVIELAEHLGLNVQERLQIGGAA